MKKLLVAAMMVVLPFPAFAAIQNVKVSGDITSTFLYRNDFDLGLDKGLLGQSPAFVQVGLKNQNVFITQTRLRVDADLSDNVSTTVGIINERAWNAENTSDAGVGYSNDTDVQLYLASITMREMLYSPLTVTIGRQVFSFGNGLIMGDGGPNIFGTGNLANIAQDLTERTAYDGVRATLDYKPLTIDMFYFKNGQTFVNGNFLGKESSSDVYGFDSSYQLSDPWSTLVEAYMFSRINGDELSAAFDTALNPSATLTNKGDTLFVPGLRASTNPTKSLNLQGEVAWQFGQHPVVDTATGAQTAEKRDAMAGQFLASYSLPVLEKYKPTLNGSFTYVSGDKDAKANTHDVPFTSSKTFTAWDPFNETQGSGTIYNTMFLFTNMYIYSLGASVNPLEDVTTSFTWSDLYAAQGYNATWNPLALYQPDEGTVPISPVTTNKKGLGNEYDVNVSYNYTEDVTFGVSLGWFVPGDAFNKVNRDDASQAIADVNVKF